MCWYLHCLSFGSCNMCFIETWSKCLALLEVWPKLPIWSRHHFQRYFLEQIFCILIWISLQFVSKGPTDKKLGLVEVMAWGRTGQFVRYSEYYLTHAAHMATLCVLLVFVRESTGDQWIPLKTVKLFGLLMFPLLLARWTNYWIACD